MPRHRPGADGAAPGSGRRPVIGGVLAGLVGLRRAFLVTAGFYAIGLARRAVALRRATRLHARPERDAPRRGRVDVPQRAGVRELHPDDGRDLRCSSSIAASGRSCRSTRADRRRARAGGARRRVPVFDHGVRRRGSGITSAAGCWRAISDPAWSSRAARRRRGGLGADRRCRAECLADGRWRTACSASAIGLGDDRVVRRGGAVIPPGAHGPGSAC